MKNRRRYKRISLQTHVEWRIKASKKQGFANGLILDTHNITKRGIFLKTRLRPKNGTPVELKFTTHRGSAPIKLNGKVVWTARKATHPYLYPGIGIKFDKVCGENYKALNAFLKNKSDNFRDAVILKQMYLELKNMASKLVDLEERHASAVHLKKVIDNAINEIDDVAHVLDKEINEIKNL